MNTPQQTDQENVSQPVVPKLCLLLSQASYNLTTELAAELETLGISPRAHEVLATAATGGHTQVELARLIGLDKTTMVVTLDDLEAAGLIERRLSRTDRRVRMIAVTETGQQKLLEAEAIVTRVHADVLSVLLPADQNVFLTSLARLVSDRLNKSVATAQPLKRRTPRVARAT